MSCDIDISMRMSMRKHRLFRNYPMKHSSSMLRKDPLFWNPNPMMLRLMSCRKLLSELWLCLIEAPQKETVFHWALQWVSCLMQNTKIQRSHSVRLQKYPEFSHPP